MVLDNEPVFTDHINTGSQDDADHARLQSAQHSLNIRILQRLFSSTVIRRTMMNEGRTTANVAIRDPRIPAFSLPT